jgi:hypothetical protein
MNSTLVLQQYRTVQSFLEKSEKTFEVEKIHPYDLAAKAEIDDTTRHLLYPIDGNEGSPFFLIDGKAYFMTTAVEPQTQSIR